MQLDYGLKEAQGNWLTFLKEDELQRGTNYHFMENKLPCVQVRPKGERQGWEMPRGRDLWLMMRSDVSTRVRSL